LLGHPSTPREIPRGSGPGNRRRRRILQDPELAQRAPFLSGADECDEINEIKNATKLRLDKQQGYSMTAADFKPNEEMRDKCLLEEGSGENGR
jgi:hypothetical protein